LGGTSEAVLMRHVPSEEDRDFQDRFESCDFPIAEFDHKSHVRLAYTYLADQGTEAAYEKMRSSLLRFLEHHGVDPTKYHETMTRAWILAVRHFMNLVDSSDSAESFMRADPRMLDSRIMLTHYSAGLLFSGRARGQFVEPDLSPIPRHDDP
jgi:hypothetical protein